MSDTLSIPERVAQRFHEVYEELAPVYGWETQKRSRVAWADVPPANKRLMVKVVSRLIHEGVIVADAGLTPAPTCAGEARA